jgi:oxygen-dependent protoporphyrinogen oxidase
LTHENIIIGAGIAGLTAAFELKKSGQDFLVLEKSSNAGGNWHSFVYKNSIYEFGPNSFMSTAPEFLEMIQEAGFSQELVAKTFKDSMRYLYLDSRLIPIKPGPGMIFSGLLRLPDWLRVLAEYFVPARVDHFEESVHEFFERRFGLPVAERVVANALQGIWAGNTRQLSMKSALPKLYSKEYEYGSILRSFLSGSSTKATGGLPLTSFSFRKGMQSFCEHLIDYLGRDKFVFSADIQDLSVSANGYKINLAGGSEYQTKNLIMATKAIDSANLLKTVSEELSSLLAKIYYAPVALFAFTIPKSLFSVESQKTLDAFGFISGSAQHLTLGSIWSSQLFSDRNLESEYLMISFMGGAKNPQILDYDEDSLWQIHVREQIEVLQKLTSIPLKTMDFTKINFMSIPQAIPQYLIGYEQLLTQIFAQKSNFPNLFLLGNYISGVSIADTIRLSKKTISSLPPATVSVS